MNQLNKPCQRGAADATEWIVRRGRLADLDRVLAIAGAAPMAAHWPEEAYRSFCADNLEDRAPLAKVLLVACSRRGQETVGFAAFQAIMTSGEYGLENMAVGEDWRRQGVATRLLAVGLLWCRAWRAVTPDESEQKDSLRLEVRASNREAIGFYQQAGFVQEGRRTGYYSQPVEDALLMSRKLSARVSA